MMRPASAGLSLRARLAAIRLDRELAEGADPSLDLLRGRRALQLASRSGRLRLARSLEDAVRRAREPPVPAGFGVPLQRGTILACEDALLELVGRLRDERPVDVQGVALVQLLLTDGRSPLYFRDAPHGLPFVARRARFALEPAVGAASIAGERRPPAADAWAGHNEGRST